MITANISGLSGAVTALLEAKKYLKGKQFTGSADGGKRDENSGSFTRKQLTDPSFYQAHEKEILLAMKQGRIQTNMRLQHGQYQRYIRCQLYSGGLG
jgi:hypothetical protein